MPVHALDQDEQDQLAIVEACLVTYHLLDPNQMQEAVTDMVAPHLIVDSA